MSHKVEIVSFWESKLKTFSIPKNVRELLPSSTFVLIEDIGLPQDDRLLLGPDLKIRFVQYSEQMLVITHQEIPYVVIGDNMFGFPSSSFFRKLGEFVIQGNTGELFILYPDNTLRFVNSTLEKFLIFAKLYIEYMAFERTVDKELEKKSKSIKKEKEVVYQASIKALDNLEHRYKEIDPVALTYDESEYYFWTNVIGYRRTIYSDERRNMLRNAFPE